MKNYDGTCTKCGNAFHLGEDGYYGRIRKNISFDLCPACLKSKNAIEQFKSMTVDQKQSLNNQRSKSHLEHWKNVSNEWKHNRNQKISDGYKNMSDNEKEKISKIRTESNLNYWASLSEEDKSYRSKVNSEAQLIYNGKLSKEDLAHRGKLISDGHAKRSDSEKLTTSKKQSIAHKKYLATLSEEELSQRIKPMLDGFAEYIKNESPDEKQRRIDKMKEYVKNESMEQFASSCYNRAVGIAKSIKGKTEYSFANDLSMYGLSYEWGYVNQIIHPDFHKIFPTNPITNSRVSPYHAWDFKVANILIDIDGSEHTIQPKEFITKGGIDVGSIIQFNDSQRPHQTDGMQWYIIQAYNDKLSNDTKILGSSGKFITYRDLLTILQFYNTKKKEG